jgi:hypothetical protein
MQQHTRHFWTHLVKVAQQSFVGKCCHQSLAFSGSMVGTLGGKTHSHSIEYQANVSGCFATLGVSHWFLPNNSLLNLRIPNCCVIFMSKHLNVPRSFVQTIVHKHKHHGITQPSYHSGMRRVLSPRDERTFVQNVRFRYMDMLKQLKTSVRKLKLGSKLPKLWQNGLRTTKSRYWSGHHKALTSIP